MRSNSIWVPYGPTLNRQVSEHQTDTAAGLRQGGDMAKHSMVEEIHQIRGQIAEEQWQWHIPDCRSSSAASIGFRPEDFPVDLSSQELGSRIRASREACESSRAPGRQDPNRKVRQAFGR
jgi:hypothetical protein